MTQLIRWRLFAGVLLILTSLTSLATVGASPSQSNGDVSRQSVIVVFHDSVENPGNVARELGPRHDLETRFVYNHAVKGFAADLPARAVAAISQDPRVAFVELDQEVHAFADIPTGIDRSEADQNPTANIDGTDQRVGVDIAIIDTGIDHNHPALNVVDGTNCTKGNPFNVNCQDGFPGDGNGHGTHVAGTAAGIDGSGLVGVAPGANLWAVKVLDDNGSGRMSQIVAGIDWVTARAGTIEVANMSLGCECQSAALDAALDASTNAGVIYTVAAGNSGADTANFSPANHPQVITVSAMADFDGLAGGAANSTCRNDVGEDDTFATFSNYGDEVDIAAPGVCIKSAYPGGGDAELSGTSMASPHVAGAAALYVVENNVSQNQTRWQTVRDGIVNNWSVLQTDGCGFTAGKSNEPLLLLANCDSTSDGGDNEEEATTGTLAGSVTDVSTGVSISGATITIEGTSFSTTTGTDGSYTIGNVDEGTYNIVASADGYESESQTGIIEGDTETVINFTLSETATPETGTVSVVNIDYQTRGGKNNDRHLEVTLTLEDAEANPVANASVQADLTRDNSDIWGFSGTTETDGSVTFTLNNAPSGSYETVVIDVSADGLTWDQETPNNEYTKQ